VPAIGDRHCLGRDGTHPREGQTRPFNVVVNQANGCDRIVENLDDFEWDGEKLSLYRENKTLVGVFVNPMGWFIPEWVKNEFKVNYE